MDSSVLAQVIAAVKEAGRLLTDPNAVAEIRAKSVTDYVTNVDVAVQTQLKGKLAALTPDVQFMGEEQDNAGLDPHGSIWILDPVDGTTNLIHNFHFSAISLALYEGGQVGIRIENELECYQKEVNQYGTFLAFEPVTFVPIDTSPIVPGVLSGEQIEWLNHYHRQVFEKLAPRLNEEERDWLAKKCAAIGC